LYPLLEQSEWRPGEGSARAEEEDGSAEHKKGQPRDEPGAVLFGPSSFYGELRRAAKLSTGRAAPPVFDDLGSGTG
jgi:hypothetical protein